jgi:hypothetical protein
MTLFKDHFGGLRFNRPKDWIQLDAILPNTVAFGEPWPRADGSSGARATLQVRLIDAPGAAGIYMDANPNGNYTIDRHVTVDGASARLTGYLMKHSDVHLAPSEWLFVDGVKQGRSFSFKMGFPSDQRERYLAILEAMLPSIKFGGEPTEQDIADRAAARIKARELRVELDLQRQQMEYIQDKYGAKHPIFAKARERLDQVKAELARTVNVPLEPEPWETQKAAVSEPTIRKRVPEFIVRALSPTQLGMFDRDVRRLLEARLQSAGALRQVEVQYGPRNPLVDREREALGRIDAALSRTVEISRKNLTLKDYEWPAKPGNGIDAQTVSVEDIAKLDAVMAKRLSRHEHLIAMREKMNEKFGERHGIAEALDGAIEDENEEIARYAREWRDLQGRLY